MIDPQPPVETPLDREEAADPDREDAVERGVSEETTEVDGAETIQK